MIITNREIYTLLKNKDREVTEGRKLTSRIDDLEEARNKRGLQIQKIKDKVIPLIEREMEGKLGEFEVIGEVIATSTPNEIEVVVIDQVEEFKKAIKEKKAKANADSSSSPSDEQPPTPELAPVA